MFLRLFLLFTLIPLLELYLLSPPGRKVIRRAVTNAASRRFGRSQPGVIDVGWRREGTK